MARPDKEIITYTVSLDPAADQIYPLFRAPVGCTVTGAYAAFTDSFNATDAAYLTLALYNGGTLGTAVTALSGTIGGTAGTPSWTGLTFETLSILAGALTVGEVVTLHYDETGANAPGLPLVVQLEIDY